MIKLKSTKQVTVNPVSEYKSNVFLEIKEILFNEFAKASFSYFYYDKNRAKNYISIKKDILVFDFDTLVQLEQAVGGLTGDNFIEKLKDLVAKLAIYNLTNVEPTFGLSGNEWEVTTEETPDVLPQEEPVVEEVIEEVVIE
jgi:hypothetical protein